MGKLKNQKQTINMKRKIQSFIMLTLFSGLLLSCGQNQEANHDTAEPTVYNVEGEDIVIRVGPGENFDKLINKTAYPFGSS
jgi:hypothetical protein